MFLSTPVKPCPVCHGRRTNGNGHLCRQCHGAGEMPDSASNYSASSSVQGQAKRAIPTLNLQKASS
jgi:DnaJ-class molecular chaperone